MPTSWAIQQEKWGFGWRLFQRPDLEVRESTRRAGAPAWSENLFPALDTPTFSVLIERYPITW